MDEASPNVLSMLRDAPESSREPLVLRRVERVSDFVSKIWLVGMLLWLMGVSVVLTGLAASRVGPSLDICYAAAFNHTTTQCLDDFTITVSDKSTGQVYSGSVDADGYPGLEGDVVAVNHASVPQGTVKHFSTGGAWPETNTGVQLGSAIPCTFFSLLFLLLLHRHFLLERDYTTQATLLFFLFCCTAIFLTAIVLDGLRLSSWRSDDSLCSILSSGSDNIFMQAGDSTARVQSTSCSFEIFYATIAFDVICFVSGVAALALAGTWAIGTAPPLSECEESDV